MADVTLDWNENAEEVFLRTVEDQLFPRIQAEVHALAESIAPVRRRHGPVPPWAKRGHVGVRGRLKASTVSWDGRDELGRYWNVGALWYGRFLDPKARQLHYLRPFLVHALKTTVDGRVYR